MAVTYFFYGLSFFSLGLATTIYPKHADESWLARNIRWVAAFGILHAANEWIDMFQMVRYVNGLEPLALALAAASFFCLLWFGVVSLVERGAPRATLLGIAVFPAAWIVVVWLARENPSAQNIGTKYLLGLPGTVLTGVALWVRSRSEYPSEHRSHVLLRVASVAFVVYGVSTGVIGPEASFFPASVVNQSSFLAVTGVPIQVVRAAIAFVIAAAMTGTLKVFDTSNRTKLKREVVARTRELSEINDRLMRQAAEREERESKIRESEARYRDLFENANDAIFIIDSDLNYVDVNKQAEASFGYSRDEFLSMNIVDLLPGDQLQSSEPEFQKIREQKPYERFVGKAKTSDGRLLDVEVSSSPIINDGSVVGSRDIVRDITDRTQLEQQLLQAQKMEAVGQLAGGIAHDFNNILTAILGFAELMKPEIRDTGRHVEWLQAIVDSAERAVSLTRNLLAFSRKQVMHMRPMDLNAVVHAARSLLASSIGEDVDLITHEYPDPLVVSGDENQLTQVVVNLATNARDAMPSGGTLTITVSRQENPVKRRVGQETLPEGTYAVLSVVDTGDGMDETTIRKIFDPFFTTKSVGKGTGLGLSTAYGVVKQHVGVIHARSELGLGTEVEFFLPVQEGLSPVDVGGEALAPPKRGSETILLAEDDDMVRELMARVLSKAGYSVISATDGRDAVETFTAGVQSIDLVILDVIMPRMNGKEAYDEICRVKGDIKALFVTGYADDIVAQRGLSESGPRLIDKPVAPFDLLSAVRDILDRAE